MSQRAALFLATVAVLGACAPKTSVSRSEPAPAPDSAAWVNGLMKSLSLEQKVGQMLMTRIEGDFDNIAGAELQRARRQIKELGVGGLAVGIGTPTETAAKLNALQRESAIPLLFAADLEWGSGMRLWRPTFLPYGIEGGGGTAFPFNMGVAATGDVNSAETAGRITAREARAVGVHWLFAPVADVNTRPANPIVNVRSYGSDPVVVGTYVASFVRGAHSAGALTTVKHFPGHGDTEVDSHVELPVLQKTRASLDAVELVPFKTAVQAGVDAVMTGHLAIPSVTGPEVPATVAPAIGTLIRKDLAFNGIIVTDAMTMGALRKLPGYSPGEIAVRAVEAGADVVLSPPNAENAHTAIVEAVQGNRLTVARIDSSVRRILGAKAHLGLQRQRLVALDSVNAIVAAPEHERMAALIAQRSITLARDSGNLVPFDARRVRSVAVIAFSAPNDLNAGRALAAELRRAFTDVQLFRLDESLSADRFDQAVNAAGRADAIIFATFLMPISGQGHIAVHASAAQLATRVRALNRPVVTVSFGDPYGPAQLPTANSYLLAWQPRAEHAQIAVARALAGINPITGVLPIELPGAARGSSLKRDRIAYRLTPADPKSVGMDPAGLARVDSIIEAAIADRAAPGAALAVGRHGRLVRLSAYGELDYRPGFATVTDSALFDLASLTKVVATTTAAMILVQDGLLELDAPVARYLPEWDGAAGKEPVTVRNLLAHNAGLPPFKPFWRDTRGRGGYLRSIGALPLEYKPGTQSVYSDIGLITTAFIVERITGRAIDDFLRERLFQPLGLRETMYNPVGPPSGPPNSGLRYDSTMFSRIAPTEIDTVFRKQHVHGFVHDENAFAIGGVAGHAGLFSSARDLAAFAQMLLNGGFYNGRRILAPEVIDMFRKRQNDYSTRALGWDTPGTCSDAVSSGNYFTLNSIGHTGFTGTSIWIDFERDVFVVLLTNRVNPTRANQKQTPLRRAVADAVQQAITDVPVGRRCS